MQTIRQLSGDIRQDLRYAVRSLRKRPAFAAVAILTLAVGIGATTAVFSIVNAVLLKPLPYPEPDRIVVLAHTRDGSLFPAMSEPKFSLWREAKGVLQDAAAYRFPVTANFTSGEHLEQLVAGHVSADFFALFGARVEYGRTFTDDEDRTAGANVVVLSHGFWQRRFGGASSVVGQSVTLDGEPHVVVGVLSAAFDPRSASPFVAVAPDVWVALRVDPSSQSDAHNIVAAARLRPETTLAEAQAQTQVTASSFRQKFPGVMPPNLGLTVAPLAPFVVGNARPSLLLLAAAVTFLLLIVVANTAGLLIVRASERQREFAIRAATGASRSRMVRQMLTESLVLAGSGGALGLWIGFVGVRALLAIQPGNIPRIAANGSDVGLDWRVLLFALATSVVSAVAAGLLPAWRGSRLDLNAVLKASTDRGGESPHQKARAALVIAEIAIAVMLLVGATLILRSFIAVRDVDPGFDGRGVLTMRLAATDRRFTSTLETVRLVDDSARRVGALPGIEIVAATLTELPLEGDNANLKIEVPGRSPDDSIVGSWRLVSPGYFAVFRIPLIRGRVFTDRDSRSSPAVAIINQALARRFWPNADPLGDRILLGRGAGPEFEDTPRQIIGIVGDIRQAGLDRNPRAAAYVPLAQLSDAGMEFFHRLGGRLTWTVRSSGEPSQILDAVQRELRNASGAPVTAIRTMEDVARASTARRRFEMWLMTAFAMCAALLAALGVYGVAAYSAQQRTREIGIRVALGAGPRQIRSLILGHGAGLTLLGVIAGTTAALGLARLLSAFLFGVTPHDGVVFATVPLVLGAIVLAAGWLPARRATRIDPVIALRAD